MARLNAFDWSLAAAVGMSLASASCSSSIQAPDGVCFTDAAGDCNVSFAQVGAAPQSVGLVGYSCTGSRRPHGDARYQGGVPVGTLSAPRGRAADGKQKYCCSPRATSCAFDPVS